MRLFFKAEIFREKKQCNMSLPEGNAGVPHQAPQNNTLPTNIPPTPTKDGNVIKPAETLRKLLPIAAFLVAFATVMTLLLVYMNNTGKCVQVLIR